jgi:hypothetical protein
MFKVGQLVRLTRSNDPWAAGCVGVILEVRDDGHLVPYIKHQGTYRTWPIEAHKCDTINKIGQ